MLIKILIAVVILILLRRHLGIFKPFWLLCVGFAVGAVVSWCVVSQMIRLGTTFPSLEYFGCPERFARHIFAFVGGLVTIGPVSAAIWGLFPPCNGKKNELRRL